MAIDRQFLRNANLFPSVKIALEKFLNKYDVIQESAQYRQGAAVAKTVTTTLTVAEIIPPTGGLLTANPGGAAAASYTLPLGSAIETALVAVNPDLAVGDTFDFAIVNISTNAAEIVTVVTNTGLTLVGDLTVAPLIAGDQSSGTFAVRRTAAGTYSVYRK